MPITARFPFFKKKRRFTIQHGIAEKQFTKQPLRKSLFFYIVLLCLFFLEFFYLLFTFSPPSLMQSGIISIPAVFIMYVCVISIFTLISKITIGRFIHGVSFGVFAIGLHLLKHNMLFQPFLIVLLFVFICAIELAFWQRRK